MASPVDEFTLESVRDYMISRDGRVTNHELVKHFKNFLTNPACKELARNKFKQYVNTLANICQEGGEKYLVLKRKYRVGTHLSESDFLAHQTSPVGPRFASPGQYSVFGSPQHGGGFSPQGYNTSPPPVPPPPYRSTPPYRAPPPYRPPPPATPPHHGYPAPDDQYSDRRYDSPQPYNNGRQQPGGDPRYRGEPPRYPPPGEPRYPPSQMPPTEPRYNTEGRCNYDEPADLGIPPAPQVMRPPSSLSSSSSSLPPYGGPPGPLPSQAAYGGYSNQPQPPPLTPLGASRPKTLPIKSMNTSLTSPSEDGDSVSGEDLASVTLSATTTGSTGSTPSSDEPPPPVPPRKRPSENKENRRPSPEGEEGSSMNVMGGGDGGCDVGDGVVGGEDTPASVEDERKVSVKEATQKFNRMASEVQLQPSSRASSKSNRSSRSDRDDDDSSSIHSYGPEGQDWVVAAAKSDFNEILRLLKIHPTLARYKDIANGYTALHWAAKHGRHEVVKLLAGTHHVEINARSNGGYTPLHVAAMYTRTEVFDLLVHYGADLNMRDYSGKKARTYNTINSTVSHDTQKRIIQRRNSVLSTDGGYWNVVEQEIDGDDIDMRGIISRILAMKVKVKEAAGFLRIGSLNVKVRKTTEAFNNLLSRDVEARLHRTWGSSDSLPDADKESKSMPPPKFGPIKKRKTKKDRDFVAARPLSAHSALAPTEPTSPTLGTGMPPVNADSDSDSAYGFGSEWH